MARLSQRRRFSVTGVACLLLIAITALPALASQKTGRAAWVEKTLRKLSLREKIGQLVQIRVPGKFINRQSQEYRSIMENIRRNRVGGVVLFAGNVYESAILLNDLQRASRLPLLVSADFERGASFRISDTTSFPWTMAMGAAGSEELAYRQGLATARESRALGVHWIFAPVVDVNNNPANPVINIRSFGEDPALVAKLGAAFIRGAREGGALTTAKHFPGHGDTATDSHIGLAVVQSDRARLERVEFTPFRSAIAAGVDSIMTAHVAVPEVTKRPELPATLSSEILTGLLRNQLGFKGLVVTDALEMGGITEKYWCGLAAIKALQAGADVLLLPPDPTVAINEVERAVKRGDIPLARIDESVRRILSAKNRLGLRRSRTAPLARIGNVISAPDSLALAQEIADRSITVVRDQQRRLPISPLDAPRIFSLVLASDTESNPGALFQAEMRRRFPRVRTAWGNARITPELESEIARGAAEADLVVCATIVRLGSGLGSVALPEKQRQLLKQLAASGKPVIWVTMGNPYVLQLVPEIETSLCAFSYSETSQIAAAKALSGAIAVGGAMPVAVPGVVQAGAGVQIAKLDMTLKPRPVETERKLLDDFVEAGGFTGAELLVGRNGAIALHARSGQTTADSRYDIASLSGTIIPSTAFALAVESGALVTSGRVLDYVPELTGDPRGELQVRNLPAGAAASDGAVSELINTIVSRATGASVGSYLSNSLYGPLGMESALRPTRASIQRTPAVSSWSARDLGVFAQMLLNGGVYDHRRLLSPGTLQLLTGADGPWSKPSGSNWTRDLFSASAFGFSSPSGPLLWIDPEKRLFIVLLTVGTLSPKGQTLERAHRSIVERILESANAGR